MPNPSKIYYDLSDAIIDENVLDDIGKNLLSEESIGDGLASVLKDAITSGMRPVLESFDQLGNKIKTGLEVGPSGGILSTDQSGKSTSLDIDDLAESILIGNKKIDLGSIGLAPEQTKEQIKMEAFQKQVSGEIKTQLESSAEKIAGQLFDFDERSKSLGGKASDFFSGDSVDERKQSKINEIMGSFVGIPEGREGNEQRKKMVDILQGILDETQKEERVKDRTSIQNMLTNFLVRQTAFTFAAKQMGLKGSVANVAGSVANIATSNTTRNMIKRGGRRIQKGIKTVRVGSRIARKSMKSGVSKLAKAAPKLMSDTSGSLNVAMIGKQLAGVAAKIPTAMAGLGTAIGTLGTLTVATGGILLGVAGTVAVAGTVLGVTLAVLNSKFQKVIDTLSNYSPVLSSIAVEEEIRLEMMKLGKAQKFQDQLAPLAEAQANFRLEVADFGFDIVQALLPLTDFVKTGLEFVTKLIDMLGDFIATIPERIELIVLNMKLVGNMVADAIFSRADEIQEITNKIHKVQEEIKDIMEDEQEDVDVDPLAILEEIVGGPFNFANPNG